MTAEKKENEKELATYVARGKKRTDKGTVTTLLYVDAESVKDAQEKFRSQGFVIVTKPGVQK